MKFLRFFVVCALIASAPLRAVYAPIPAQEQPDNLTISVRGGVTYDTNLFGAATNAIESLVWELAPRISYHGSPTERTFLSATYGLTLNYFDERPAQTLTCTQANPAQRAVADNPSIGTVAPQSGRCRW